MQSIRAQKDGRLFDMINYFLLFLILIVILYPLLYIISASISNPGKVISGEMWLFPKDMTLNSYYKIFQNQDIMRGYWNTILYTAVGTSINIAMTVCAAYPLSQRDFLGRNAITFYIMLTMFFSGGLIPTYLLIKQLGMLNSFWVMVIPNAVAVWHIIIMRTFFQQSIPNELHEASSMDGCSHFQMLFRIILPLSLPVLAVMVLFYSVSHWNAYFNALLYLSDRSRYPLQLFLREILIQSEVQDMVQSDASSLHEQMLQKEGIKYAIIMVANLPMLLLYPFLQKYFVKGMLVGAIKG
ncbi:MAG: carbohydrate transporter permease [Paenibacillus sp.]|jgi:putative aldouronate transport system permease protein|nr:carbohydrate transporter permease [Paenibacillus sp.]